MTDQGESLPGERRLRHVVVLGLMGAGKTTIGRELATRLDWPLRDSDECILEATGQTVSELKERRGTAFMHGLEAEQLLDELAVASPSVIAAAASVVDSPACRKALRNRADSLVVWLAVDPAVLAARFASGEHRPVYGADPDAVLRDQLAARGDRLREVADVTMPTTGWTVTTTVEALIALVSRRLCSADGTGGSERPA